MVMINAENLSEILGKKVFRLCGGIGGAKCSNPRRNGGRLCVACHRKYMREYMAKKRGSKRSYNGKKFGFVDDSGRTQVIDGYDFNQENG